MSSDNELAFIMTVDIVDLLYAHEVSILTFIFHPRYCLVHLVSTSSIKCFNSLPFPLIRLSCSISGMVILLLV